MAPRSSLGAHAKPAVSLQRRRSTRGSCTWKRRQEVSISASGGANRDASVPSVALLEQSGRALLILGEPGSGKPATLLDLTRSLLEKAEAEHSQPVLVVLNLASDQTISGLRGERVGASASSRGGVRNPLSCVAISSGVSLRAPRPLMRRGAQRGRAVRPRRGHWAELRGAWVGGTGAVATGCNGPRLGR